MRPREQLTIVVRRADELSATSCLQHANQWGFTFEYKQALGIRFAVTGPNPEELDVLLRRLRPFLLAKEPTYLYSVHNLCQQAVRSDELRGYLIGARSEWTRFQRTGPIALNLNGRSYTPERVTDLFINGWYFHSDNEEKVAELAQLTAGAGPISRHIFFDYLLEATRQATYVGAVVREALRHDLVDDDKPVAA